MKKYIKSDFTMDFDNKFKVMEWLEYASNKIDKLVRSKSTEDAHWEIDDVSWGTNCFDVPIFIGRMPKKLNQKPYYEEYDRFRFCYDPEDDPDDEYNLAPQEQLDEKLDEFLDNLEYRIDWWIRDHIS